MEISAKKPVVAGGIGFGVILLSGYKSNLRPTATINGW
jgi:hypothetical protein